jgi:transposase
MEGGETIKLASEKIAETEESLIYCQSSSRQRREGNMKLKTEQNFERGLQTISDNLSKKNISNDYQKVVEKIGRLKEKYKKIASYYLITVDQKDGKVNKIKWSKDEEKANTKLAGVYCLQAWSTGNMSNEEIWRTYTTATNVEDAFRSMKSELGFRPVYHRKENRVDGHLFISLLAYHHINAIQHLLKKKNINLCWETLRKGMSTHVRITTSFKNANRDEISIRNSSKPEEFHKNIYKALGLKDDPLTNIRINK